MSVVVTGIGLLSCLGNLETSWKSLLRGESGIRIAQPFPEIPPRPLGLIGEHPLKMRTMAQENPHPIIYLVQTVVTDALEDAGLVTPLPDCGIVIASSRGCQSLWEDLITPPGGGGGFDWLETLPNFPAIAAARQVSSTGPVLAPMAACSSGMWAIAQGFELIEQGTCQRVIAGAVEAPITPLTLAGFAQMGALATTGCYPFDKQREGLVLGEGGAVLVMESEELAISRGAFIYGKVLGFSFTCDAAHVSAPSLDNRSAILAVKQCLERSQLSPSDIDYIHPHGTSTQLNDLREANLIQELFPHGVPVSSTKGATGHTLGASGVLGIVFCLMALQEQQLPPCVGLRESIFDLDLVRVARRQKTEKVLCLNFGFGGQNSAIALGLIHF
jgi:3-oxoacyl-[acyl-carrier-protein] synthase II